MPPGSTTPATETWASPEEQGGAGCSATCPPLCAPRATPAPEGHYLCAFCCPQESREEPHLRFLAGGAELKTKHRSDSLHPHKLVGTQARDWLQPHRPTCSAGHVPVVKAWRVSYQFLVGRRKGRARTQLWEAAGASDPRPNPLKLVTLSRGEGPRWPTSLKATANPRDWGAERLWALGCPADEGVRGGSRTAPSLSLGLRCCLGRFLLQKEVIFMKTSLL